MLGQSFHLEFEFETFEKASAPEGQQRRIGGWVSTDKLDKHGEIVIQEGLDFGPFLKSGFFNDNHLKTTGKAVGFPTIAELRARPDGKKGHYVEGYLIEGHPPADEIWSLAKALEKSGAPRRLGYSVEGSILERDSLDPRTVRRAIVREVAITRCPVNDDTSLTLLAKSLSVGHAVASPGAVAGSGFPMRAESLEGGETEEERKKREAAEKAKSSLTKSALSKSEAIRFLMSRNERLSEMSATRIVEFALRNNPRKEKP